MVGTIDQWLRMDIADFIDLLDTKDRQYDKANHSKWLKRGMVKNVQDKVEDDFLHEDIYARNA